MKQAEWFGRLVKVVEDSDMSYRDISLKSGLSTNYVQQMVKNKTNPTIPKLIAITQTLNVSLIYILLGADGSAQKELLVSEISRLTPEDQEAIQEIIRRLVAKQRVDEQ